MNKPIPERCTCPENAVCSCGARWRDLDAEVIAANKYRKAQMKFRREEARRAAQEGPRSGTFVSTAASVEITTAAIPCVAESSSSPFVFHSDGTLASVALDFDAEACSACLGMLARTEVGPRGRVAKACRGATLSRRAEVFNRAGIPAHFAEASLHDCVLCDPDVDHDLAVDLPPSELATAIVFEEVREWAETVEPGDRGLWLAGDIGVGKTHLMCAALKHLACERGQEVVFVRFASLLSRLKSSFNRSRLAGEHETAEQILEPLARIPFLAIDDLGATRRIFEVETLELLISARADRTDGTLIVASNYTPDELARLADTRAEAGRYPPMARTVSRLRPMVTLVGMTGRDRRLTQ